MISRKIRLIYLLILVLGASGKIIAQDTVRMTLDSCLRYAYQNNVNVRTAELNLESARTGLLGAKMAFLPTVNASANQGLSWADQTTRSGSYGVNASLNLFSGLSNVKSYQQAQLTEQQKELSVRQAQNAICSKIISAYLTILMNEEKLTYQREVLETTRQQQLEGEVKYKVGKILESDYNLLEANYLTSLSEIENTELTIANNRLTLRTLLFMDEGHVIAVVADNVEEMNGGMLEPIDTIFAQAQRALPDWKINDLSVQIAEYNVGIARASFFPTLSLNAGTNYNEGKIISEDPVQDINGGLNTSLTLGLSIPILNKGNNLTRYKQSQIELQQAQIEHYNTEQVLRQEIEAQYLNTRQTLNKMRSSEALLNAYKKSYEVYVLKYEQGTITTVDMLQQQDKYLSAMNEYLQNKYSYLLDSKLLDNYTGKEIEL